MSGHRRVNTTNRWIRNHTSSCPLAAGVLGSLPTCAHGWGVPVPELVFLGVLVVLVCGLLFALSSLAFRKTDCRGHVSLFWQFCPLGMNCGFGEIWLRQGSWELKVWTGWVKCPSGSRESGDWLPGTLAWWRLLSLSGFDACWVMGLSRASGGNNGQKQHETSKFPLAFCLVSLHSHYMFLGMSGLAPLDREGQTSRVWVCGCWC